VKVILIIGHLKFVLIHSVPGALSLGVKCLGREADHSYPSSAEFENVWSYTSTLLIRLHGVVLSWKHRDHFTLLKLLWMQKYFYLLNFFSDFPETDELRQISRYGDWLRCGLPRFECRQGQGLFLLTMRWNQLWSICSGYGGKAVGSWSWSLTFI
jgi:hypothetical protein